jgi:hypothetical protein
MIKKFEEFVNEMYSPQANNAKELVAYLSELGVSENDCAEIYALSQKSKLYYTAEEAENILSRLPGCDSVDGIIAAVKTVFFGTEDNLKEWCDVDEYPAVVVGIDGKLLTGEVYYCEALDAFAKEEDDFNEEGYDWLAVKAEDEGILDDDQPDWMDDHWDWLDIYPVNLDEEYLDKEQDSWVKRK